mmetsp:Transcript_54437/g.93804  ORF Transcript_54437/g.93804 Transcript_54437/m.93804 type:complete len:260 (-) Transcript_54437:70-849(-)
MHLKPWEEHLEQVRPHRFVRVPHHRLVLGHQVQVPHHLAVHGARARRPGGAEHVVRRHERHLGSHGGVAACGKQACLEVFRRADAAVRDDGDLGDGLPDASNHGPVAGPHPLRLLLFVAPVDGQHACPRPHDLLRVLDGGFAVWKQADLDGEGHLEAGREGAHDVEHHALLVEQIGAVASFLGNALRTPEIKVHAVTLVLDCLARFQKRRWIVPTKLDDERAVLRSCFKHASSVFLVALGIKPGMDHWRVANVCAVLSR